MGYMGHMELTGCSAIGIQLWGTQGMVGMVYAGHRPHERRRASSSEPRLCQRACCHAGEGTIPEGANGPPNGTPARPHAGDKPIGVDVVVEPVGDGMELDHALLLNILC